VTQFETDLQALWLRVDRAVRSGNAPSVAVTGLDRRAGVSTLVLGLAQASAAAGTPVVAIDGHWQRPRLHKAFRARPGPGAGELLSSASPPETVVRDTAVGNLRIIPAGQLHDGVRTVSPERWGTLIRKFDGHTRIVIDAGHIGAPSALAACAAAAWTILVVEAGRSPWEAIRAGADRLSEQGANILGVVLNKRRFPIPRFVYHRL
jgi:Mrp family chromosome partitioning ATPase